jgi:hypothetical protein
LFILPKTELLYWLNQSLKEAVTPRGVIFD